MKALGSIIVTLVMRKLYEKSKGGLDHGCQVYRLDNKWNRESVLESREKQVQLKSEFEDIATSVQRR